MLFNNTTRYDTIRDAILTCARKPTQVSLIYRDKSSPLNSTHYAMLYPQNDDRVVAIDSVTSLHPVYSKKVKFSHTRYRALGPELIPVYRQSARR